MDKIAKKVKEKVKTEAPGFQKWGRSRKASIKTYPFS